MKGQNYHNSITVDITAEEALANIARVSAWWANDFQGSAQELGDLFTIRFGETWVTFKIAEAVPNKRIVWEVTDCYLGWLKDKTEWKGTKILWEISTDKGSTRIDFTHIGLVPEIEMFQRCKVGWNFYIEKSLFQHADPAQGVARSGIGAGARSPRPKSPR